MLRYFFHKNASPFATFIKVMATSAMGVYLGSTLAIHGSKYLDTAGLFHYVPEDDDADGDEDNVNDSNEDNNKKEKPVNESNKVISSLKSSSMFNEELLTNWAMESTGDLTLNTTINLHHWDPDVRAFQLLQYRFFLMNLDKQTPSKSQKDEYREWHRLRTYVKESIDDLELRLNKA